ncbi:DUF805 domain-containing protein [Staphylococcus xylosus]|uniref:DUF805 domain-containing protein n=1 Tax=Staphylococcus xylosus TaxID=1288 RepID=UPI000853E464|nr:DUF805 domain-containing protein [Staphylococcus xylosus]MBG3874456.1 DUF805 domain-containing protein [Staphylococcus xylosus]MBM6638446.1 DUF805 domain-containing protein [Staphylococcus xylosus]MCA2499608.1 DUF805 domain-containing protein [Staphylococcus xylosus]MCA2503054.1 DUF805 domain-containing protein [Staphylococcus xylosus]MCE7779314.1 DUF805 domain-containing protein [Staphylococcus xylosus]
MERKIGFGQALKLYWKNYVNFTGRSRRSEYWFMVLWHIIFLSPAIIVGFIGFCMLIASVSGATGSAIGLSAILLLLSIIYACIYSIATFIPNWAILIRRFHDTGRTMVMPLVYLGISLIANVVNFVIEQNDPNETNTITSIILIVFGLLNLGLGIYMIVIACFDSERKTNKYGSSHKYGQHIQSSDYTQNNHSNSFNTESVQNDDRHSQQFKHDVESFDESKKQENKQDDFKY